MSWGPCAVLCCLIAACAADHRVDPNDLELRDVLGIAPDVALTWSADERAAARQVLEAGMRSVATSPAVDAPVGRAPTLDRSLATALAAADATRAQRREAPLGVVSLAVGHDHLHASARVSTLAPRRGPATELQLAGWQRRGWGPLPSRGIDVLTTIAADAGHRGGPLLVTPAPQLAVIAAYVPATSASGARLVVNPVLLAALEPSSASAAAAVVPDDPIGNPYTFYTSIASCAAAQAQRCEACLGKGTCTPLEGTGDGNAECTQLAANDGRGYSLACINFALAIDTVASCSASAAPACPIETRAATSIALLTANADFLDQPTCAGALDQCLGEIYGDASPTSTPPPAPGSSVSCADAACESSPDCSDSGCGDDTGDSSCDGSSDSGDSSCDSGDSGGDCGGDSGGDCSSGDSGGDCSGGDSGCSGDSGGDCSGGGGDDCNASRHHGPGDRSLLWAALPLPFAIFARRRAGRRRAKREVAP